MPRSAQRGKLDALGRIDHAEVNNPRIQLSIRPFVTVLGAASLATLAGILIVPTAQAMPMTAPTVQDSGVAAGHGSSLVEQVYWRRGWRGGPRRGFCFYHPRRCRR
jgi:hypothetical protein